MEVSFCVVVEGEFERLDAIAFISLVSSLSSECGLPENSPFFIISSVVSTRYAMSTRGRRSGIGKEVEGIWNVCVRMVNVESVHKVRGV